MNRNEDKEVFSDVIGRNVDDDSIGDRFYGRKNLHVRHVGKRRGAGGQEAGRRRAAQVMEKKGTLPGGGQSILERGKPCIRGNRRSGGGRASCSSHLSRH